MRLDAVHTLRATPRHHASGVPGGAAARHATRDSAARAAASWRCAWRARGGCHLPLAARSLPPKRKAVRSRTLHSRWP